MVTNFNIFFLQITILKTDLTVLTADIENLTISSNNFEMCKIQLFLC